MATNSKSKASEKPASKSKMKEDAPVSTSNLPFALQRLEKLLGGASNAVVTISALESKSLVSIQSQGGVAEVQLPPLHGLTESWDFPFPTLSNAVHNRPNAEISFKSGELHIKDRRYNATLQGSETKALLRVEKPTDPPCSVKMTSEIWAALAEMTTKVKVSKSLAAMPDITIHYAFSKKRAVAVAFDRFQMAAFALPNTFGVEFALTLPLSRAESLFKNGVGTSSLLASDALVYAKAGNISFSTSLPSVEDTTGVPVGAVLEQIKKLREAKFSKQVFLPKVEIQRFLDNSKAISNANALLQVEVGEGSSKLTLSSEGNKVSATIPSKAKRSFSFKLDIGYVNTIVSKSADDVQMEIDDGTLVFRTEQLIYASVLSVDDEAENEETSKKKSKKKEED